MTNRERVIAALKFETPDYTPYHVEFTSQMLEKMIAYTGRKDYYSRINNHITSVSLGKPEVEVKPEYFRDEFGVVWNKSGADKDIGVIDEIILKTHDDLKKYDWPMVDAAHIKRVMERLSSDRASNFKVAAIGFSLFERAWTLRGMENLMCDMMEEPGFVHELMEKITRRNLEMLDIALAYDFDCFYFGDDWGQQKGLIMGPRCWRAFIKPYLSKMYERVRDAGRFVSQHSCGDIREIMDDVTGIGLNMYQTYQPEIYGFDYAKSFHGKLTIWGGISTQRDLPVKTPDEIRAMTADILSRFPDGGLVAAPTHAVPGDVPPENIEALLEILENQYT
jgi:uroporphyrinogen decarboxylase